MGSLGPSVDHPVQKAMDDIEKQKVEVDNLQRLADRECTR
jgi:hypothetical protein